MHLGWVGRNVRQPVVRRCDADAGRTQFFEKLDVERSLVAGAEAASVVINRERSWRRALGEPHIENIALVRPVPNVGMIRGRKLRTMLGLRGHQTGQKQETKTIHAISPSGGSNILVDHGRGVAPAFAFTSRISWQPRQWMDRPSQGPADS